jgi:hypothetical protein
MEKGEKNYTKGSFIPKNYFRRRSIKGRSLTLHGVGLFRSDCLIGDFVTQITISKWSHVAMILRDITKDPTDQTGWYCFETNGELGSPSNPVRVQINPWGDVVSKYKGDIAIRDIQYNETKAPDSKAMSSFVKSYLGKPFKLGYGCFLLSIWNGNRKQNENLNSFFCSELTACMLREFGLLPKHIVASNYWPKDFSSEINLALIGASWGAEVSVNQK